MWPTASYGIVLVAARALLSAFYRGGQPPLGDLDQTGALPSRRTTPKISAAFLISQPWRGE